MSCSLFSLQRRVARSIYHVSVLFSSSKGQRARASRRNIRRLPPYSILTLRFGHSFTAYVRALMLALRGTVLDVSRLPGDSTRGVARALTFRVASTYVSSSERLNVELVRRASLSRARSM